MNIVGKSATRIPIKCIAGDQQAALSEQMYVEK
jgi:glycerol kinase